MAYHEDPRFHMFCRLIPGYEYADNELRFALKKDLLSYSDSTKLSDFQPNEEDIKAAEADRMKMMSLANLECKSAAMSFKIVGPTPDQWDMDLEDEEEGEETMYTPTQTDTIKTERQHLRNRVAGISVDKTSEASTAFHIYDDNSPSTFQSLLDRIASGKYVFDKEAEAKKGSRWGYSLFDFVQWRDPATPADTDGFKAWSEKFSAAETKTLDDVAILDPKDALASVRELETFTVQ